MSTTGVVELTRQEFLRAVYELTDMRAKLAVALTYVGLRRARRMAERGWGAEVPF